VSGSVAFSIDDNLNLMGELSVKLHVNNEHKINTDNIMYHRVIHGYNTN